jgi:hypothetical protein
MPHRAVDYSKTVIYKIQHNDDETLLYVGSTTNFNNRKSQHKCHCINENDKSYNRKVYRMIRDNGGWDCFSMTKIEDYPCENGRDAEAREDQLMRELKANMNTQRAFIEDKAAERKVYDLRWRQNHREYELQRVMRWREAHREEHNDYQRRWREAHPNYHRERYARIKREEAAAEEQ